MSDAALERLVAGADALVAALDEDDLAGIQTASHAMRDTLSIIAASGGWRDRPETRARLVQALRLTEAAGGRMNYLADRARRQLDRLAALSGGPRTSAYGRSGRLS